MAKTIITGAAGASTGNSADSTEGTLAPVTTGRRKSEGGK